MISMDCKAKASDAGNGGSLTAVLGRRSCDIFSVCYKWWGIGKNLNALVRLHEVSTKYDCNGKTSTRLDHTEQTVKQGIGRTVMDWVWQAIVMNFDLKVYN